MLLIIGFDPNSIPEFETVRTLKIQKTRLNLDQKSLPKINNYEKTNKKGRKKKEGNLPKPPFMNTSGHFDFLDLV